MLQIYGNDNALFFLFMCWQRKRLRILLPNRNAELFYYRNKQTNWVKPARFFSRIFRCFYVKQNVRNIRQFFVWDGRHALWIDFARTFGDITIWYYHICKKRKRWTKYFCYIERSLIISDNLFQCRLMIGMISYEFWAMNITLNIFSCCW